MRKKEEQLIFNRLAVFSGSFSVEAAEEICLPKAEEILDESLTAAHRTGNNLALSIAKVNYGRLEIAKNNLAQAKDLCQESLRLRGELSDPW